MEKRNSIKFRGAEILTWSNLYICLLRDVSSLTFTVAEFALLIILKEC